MYAIIDVETTGGQARYERITEIAIVLHDGARVVDTFSTLLNPERSIPWNITQLTGITDDMVAHPRYRSKRRRWLSEGSSTAFVKDNRQSGYHNRSLFCDGSRQAMGACKAGV